MLSGFLVLWYVTRRRQRRRTDTPSLNNALHAAGWILFLVGLTAALLMAGGWAAPILWLGAAIVVIAAVRWYRRAEGRALLWALTDAAERNIPLEAAARAYGEEIRGLMGQRAIKLAEYVEAAVPLSMALRLARIPVPPDVQLAADVGERTGTLGPALSKVSSQLDESDLMMRSVMEKTFYVAFLCCWLPTLLPFLLIKIVPAHAEIMEEFGLELPAVTKMLIGFSRTFAHTWFLAAPFVVVLAFFVFAGLLSYAGFSFRRLPFFNRFVWRMDSASILRLLAIAVRQGRPIAESVRLLAGYMLQPGPQRRLERAAVRISKGGNWCEVLRQVGVIRASESRLLAAAERAGNLPWAMEEMASSMIRRVAYRTRVWVTAAFPVLIIVFGFGVLFVAVALLLPLMKMIQGLC